MKGSEAKLLNFMEGANYRYVIPVYQRKYDWKRDNCEQLYDDLKSVIRDHRDSHFFGSIVSQVIPEGANIHYQIIDGQQRLTTVTLLLLAMSNLIRDKKIKSEEHKLDEQIMQRFLIAPWAAEEDKIKLRPVREDREALKKLFGQEEDFDRSSNLTINYYYFCEQLLREEVSVDDLYAAIGKLEIISILLEHGDNPQLIFESLNSTGLALTEGDKIRNYILMGLTPKEQTQYYDKYWTKIEKCTQNNVSGFVRDYLSIKQQVTPTISNVYHAFKKYAEEANLQVEDLLASLLEYARYYEKLLTGNSGLNNQELDDCLYRLNRLEVGVTRPFFMEVLRLNHEGKLSVDDVLQVFLITENYLFRRNICDVPTNALNKVFLNLNRDILRYDNTVNDYVDKFVYALLTKKESGRFPRDDEFSMALSEKQVYQMRGKYKVYLFERFENYGTIETKDVYKHLDQNDYSIEHIMPQHLTPAWIESLGPDYETIHETWLHRLANLTLTGYNPSLSNNTFIEKRDAKVGGYKNSGLRMTQKIAAKDSWGLPELEERNKRMVNYATKEIWKCPATAFRPAIKEFDSCTLEDENYDLTGRDIIKYSYQNMEQPVASWADMLEHVLKFLHQKDKSVLVSIAYNQNSASDLAAYVSTDPKKLRSAIKVDEELYFEKGTSTSLKISILRRLFALYNADPMDLVFYLRDVQQEKVSDESRYELRKRYWAYALPEIQKKNAHRGTFTNCALTSSNTVSGYFGLSGFSIHCVANYDKARIDMYLGNGSKEKNKKAFDLLQNHKSEIESNLGTALNWERSNDTKGSWISYSLKDVSITNEADWTRMAKFQAEWSDKFGNEMIPILEENFSDETEEERNKRKRIAEVAGYVHEWGMKKIESGEIDFDLAKSNRAYSRFRTKEMSALFPDVEGELSDWNVLNHYFYEIRNTTGDSLYIQLALNSKNLPEDQRKICEHICDLESTKYKENWDYVLPIRTSTENFGMDTGKEAVFESLDKLLKEILEKQNDLLKRLEKSR
jgi:uncharacterized protein with ParB-like and HNH nuclease domain